MGFPGALGVDEVLPNQLRVDAVMDAATRIRAHGENAKGVLERATSILSDVFEQLLPDQQAPSSVTELVQSLAATEDLFSKYLVEKTKAGAKTALTFALAGGVDGDFEKAFEDVPRRPDGKKVPLKPHADRAGKLADLLAALVAKISDAKTSTSASASVAP